ncbi:MAG: GNAT family N-acetyltransferase [Sedimentisphaerales bacterium]|nr:GNAT family N-acetyltransferase [Sedimentisphaerales bacterium]
MKNLDRFDTKRLRAERLRQEHFEFINRMNRDKRIMAHLGGLRSLPQTKEYMERNLDHWQRYGYGIWVLRLRETGLLAGRGGLRNTVLAGKDEVEIAYGLIPEFWNMGLAAEFVETVVQIGFSEIGLSNLACITQPGNMASKRVLEKSKFKLECDIIYQDKPHLLFRRDKD